MGSDRLDAVSVLRIIAQRVFAFNGIYTYLHSYRERVCFCRQIRWPEGTSASKKWGRLLQGEPPLQRTGLLARENHADTLGSCPDAARLLHRAR